MRGFGSLADPDVVARLSRRLRSTSSRLTALIALPAGYVLPATRSDDRRDGRRHRLRGRSRSRTSSAARRRRTCITSRFPRSSCSADGGRSLRRTSVGWARAYVGRGARRLVRRRLACSRRTRTARVAWLGSRPLVQVVRSPGPRRRGSTTLLTAHGERSPRIVEGARLLRHLLDAGSSAGRPDQRRSSHGRAPRGAPRERAPDRQRQPGRPDRRRRRSREWSLRPTDFHEDRRPHGDHVHAPRPPESFAQLDPIRNRLRFGDYFVARSYEALAERFELRVARARPVRISSCSSSGGTGERRSMPPPCGAPAPRRELERRPRVRAGDPPHRPRAVHAGGRRPHRLGALRRGHRRGALRRRPRDRTTRATPTATASCSRRATRASRSTRRSISATG